MIWPKGTSWGETQSICPRCFRTIPAVVRETRDGVLMEKACPDHGPFQVIVGTEWAQYRDFSQRERKITKPFRYGTALKKGCPEDCGLCPDHDQHTCLAILEITTRCDQECPVCLASSRQAGSDLSLPAIESALKAFLDQEGRPVPLQLSGGEPTLHGDLPAIIRRVASLGFQKMEIDTNGLTLSRIPGYASRLREAGLTGIYLQMDGLAPGVSEFIRGRNLVEEKLKAIECCQEAGLQVVLSVTVIPGLNDHLLWEMIQLATGQRLTGINFQSFTHSGRFPPYLALRPERFTLSHFRFQVEQQSGGSLRASELRPIPCPDPRCGTLTYILIHRGNLIPLNRLIQDEILFNPLAELSDWQKVIPLMKWGEGCDCGNGSAFIGRSSDLSPILMNSDYFSLGFHGMMDAYNFDVERARRCCVHELTPEGKLIPFCLYNLKYRKPYLQH